MRILYFHQYFSLPTGYQPSRSAVLAFALTKRGHELFVVGGCCKGADPGTVSAFGAMGRRSLGSGYWIVQSQVRYSNNLSPAFRVMSFLGYCFFSLFFVFKNRANLVFATTTPLTASVPMLFAKVCRGTKCVFEVRDRWPQALLALNAVSGRSARCLALLEKAGALGADVTLGLAPGANAGFRELGARSRQNFFIPNFSVRSHAHEGFGTDIKVFQRSDDVFVAYFGAHGYANSLEMLLQVAKSISSKRKSIRFIFFGDGREKEHLILLASEERLSNIFFLDPVPNVRLQMILGQVHIAVHCLATGIEREESASPNKIFEAMRAGLPIVTNWRGWLARRIVEAGAGLVVDVGSFAEALISLAADHERRSEMGKKGKLLATGEFCAVEQVNRVCKIFEEDFELQW